MEFCFVAACINNSTLQNNTLPPHLTTLFIMLRVALTGAISRATARSAVVAAPRTTGEYEHKFYHQFTNCLWNAY